MKKFMVLYTSSSNASEQMAKATPEQAKAGMEAWMAFAKKAGSAVIDLGSPLGNGWKQTPAPATVDTRVSGFSIMQAESADKLKALLKEHPHFMMPGNAIEVLEYLPLPGM